MDSPLLASFVAHYHWGLSLLTIAGIAVVTFGGKWLLMRVPTIRAAALANRAEHQRKMQKPNYAANRQWNRKWAILTQIVMFFVILPFCLTLEPQPWWQMLLDLVAILMFYDFLYYFTHRFLFHDNGFLGGPLIRVHAVHHRQHNPCRADSAFLHPVEPAIGQGLYIGSVFILSWVLGNFHVVTAVASFVAFVQINQHNHDLWSNDGFPFRYLNYASRMHHHHHARFTAGNYATISLLFDWMFGTLDDGKGWGRHRKA